MKKTCLNVLGMILFATLLFSCGNSTEESIVVNNERDSLNAVVSEDQIEEKVEVKKEAEYNKLEDYATILTKKDLVAKFGEKNLTDQVASYAEGTIERQITVVANPENGQIVTYVWEDDNQTTSEIEAHYTIYDENYEVKGTQKIGTKAGVFLGMTLIELRDWNGEDFEFSGFGWDYAGQIMPTKNSEIYNLNMTIGLDLLEYEGADFALGDVNISTQDKRLNNLKIIVSDLTIYISK